MANFISISIDAHPSTIPRQGHKNKQLKQEDGDNQGGTKPKKHPRPHKKPGSNLVVVVKQHSNPDKKPGPNTETTWKQHQKPKKKSGPNPGAAGNNPAMFQSNSKETASNLSDILKQAVMEAAIGGIQNLAVSLNEEKMKISTQKKKK